MKGGRGQLTCHATCRVMSELHRGRGAGHLASPRPPVFSVARLVLDS